MKRILLAALAAAAFLIPAIGSRPPPAQAGGLCDLGIFSPFCGQDAPPIPDPVLCGVRNVVVRATPDGKGTRYRYDLACNRGTPTIHVIGDYGSDTKIADESLTTAQTELIINWNCANDPWIAASAETCSVIAKATSSIDGDSGIPNFPFDEYKSPFSTFYLNDQARQVLIAAQQQYAANHTALQVIESPTTTINNCALCTVLGQAPAPAPTLPDLKVPTVGGDKTLAQGLTSVYSIGVSNLGTRPPTQAQVSIQVTDAIEYLSMTQTPAGWDCSGTSPILCVGPIGGSGDPVQNLAVNFQLQVRGAMAGVGAITVTADPNDLIQESDETNNSTQLIVAVK